MRIGLDMLTIQAAGEDRGRAATEYARLLVSSLLSRGADHQFILYGHDEQSLDAIPSARCATFVPTTFGRPPNETTAAGRLEWLAAANPDRLDWLVILDPFTTALGFATPARPLAPDGLKIAAVVADLSPFLLPERDLTDPEQAERGYRTLERLRKYDAILTPSESTRNDLSTLLGFPPERSFAIGHAADRAFFVPEDSLPMSMGSRRMLHGLGIIRAFVLIDAGRPGPGDVERMIQVFRMLPERLRQGYQLVFVGDMAETLIERARQAADADPACRDALRFTGAVSRDGLRRLFQHCAVFVHPGHHGGFGQPILEAMLCGAAVVAGDTPAQAELVGNAGLLADPDDAGALADRIARLLDDWPMARSIRTRAAARERQMTGERAAANALSALKRVPRLRADRPHRFKARPRIAVFTPLPPLISGIADYAVRLIEELKASYAIDLYHDAGYLPDLGLKARDFATYDARLFERNNDVLDYRATVYQMGNALGYHGYLYDALQRHPGVVTLHDFLLSVYPYRGTRGGDEVLASFRREIRHYCPDRADEFLPQLEDWCEEEGGLGAACARRGLYLNRRVFESAMGVVVHSPWCLEQVRAWMPEHAGRTVVIPMGASPTSRSAAERDAIRDRFALPRDALVVSCLGFIHPDKLVPEALDAFQAAASEDESAWFVCVGDECDGGASRRRARELGLADRVRFLGRKSADAYADLIHATDVGINLRRPPTNGETSAALLDLLAAGVATLVTDVATFADYPDTVVSKVRWDAHGPENLRRALHTLVADRKGREALGRAAQAHVREHHAWATSAGLYVELIERCAVDRLRERHRRSTAAPAKESA